MKHKRNNKRRNSTRNNVRRNNVRVNNEKSKITKRIIGFFSYLVKNNLVNSCISAVAIIISIFSLKSNDNVLNPKFSLSLFHIDGTGESDLNRILKIYNCGGQIVNSKLEPKMFLDICYSNEDSTYQGDILIEIRNYFPENYFFDYNESAFVIQETMANEVYSFVDNINNTLEELDLYHINLFSIKTYYSITYSNYSGKRSKRIFEPANNNYYEIYVPDNDREYYYDNELYTIDDIPEADIEMSLGFPLTFVANVNAQDGSYSAILYEDISEKDFILDCILPVMQDHTEYVKENDN